MRASPKKTRTSASSWAGILCAFLGPFALLCARGSWLMRALTAVASAVLLIVAAAPLAAHHSFAAEYDANKPVTLHGSVTRVEWTNPHARFYIDVKESDGSVTSWNLELASPNVLVRQGWTRSSLKIGDEITVSGSMAK